MLKMNSAIIINTVDEFNQIYEHLYNVSLISKNPNIHHIGFDIEYINRKDYPESFSRIQGQNDPNVAICQIQIAAKDFCFLIAVHKTQMIPRLKEIITSTSWIKSGVDISADLKRCMECFNITSSVSSYIDLKTFAILEGVSNPNLENLISIFLNCDYQKVSSPINDWTLDVSQDEKLLNYLIQDAYFSWILAKKYIPPFIVSDEFKTIPTISIDIPTIYSKKNYVGILQEYYQKNNKNLPIYIELPYNSNFCYNCFYESDKFSTGCGKNKKEAKQDAAKNALIMLGIEMLL